MYPLTLNQVNKLPGFNCPTFGGAIAYQPKPYYFRVITTLSQRHLDKAFAKLPSTVTTAKRPNGDIYIFQPITPTEQYQCAEIEYTFHLEAILELGKRKLELLQASLPALKRMVDLKQHRPTDSKYESVIQSARSSL